MTGCVTVLSMTPWEENLIVSRRTDLIERNCHGELGACAEVCIEYIER